MQRIAISRKKPGPVVLGTIGVLFGLFVVLALMKGSAFYAGVSANLGLSSDAVLGQLKIWTLVTHVLMPPLVWFNVILNCLMLWMFASELEDWWGGARTLTFFILTALGAGLATLAVGVFVPMETAGARPLVVATICAWGLVFRDRETSLFGIVNMRGIHFVWLSLAIIALDTLSYGPLSVVPRLGAVAVAAALVLGLWRKNFVKVTWNDLLTKVGLKKKAKLTVVPDFKKPPSKYDIN